MNGPVAADGRPSVAAPQLERSAEKAQRLRVRFARGAEAAEIGHLDLTRAWECAFEAAGIHLSYAGANRRQPRLTLAAGLPQGVTSDGELLDAVLAVPVEPRTVPERLAPHMPPGLAPLDAWEVGMGQPSVPTVVRYADYEVDVAAPEHDVRRAIESFLAAESIPWRDTRGEKVREYDIRALVHGISAAACDGATRLSMRLAAGTGGVGRPDQVMKALGLPEPLRVHRVRLVLAEVSPARDAWRRRGRYL